MNKKVKTSLETMEGKIMFCVVREFLEFFSLDCTLSVYEPESYLGRVYQYQGKDAVAEELGLESFGDVDSHVPLLLMLIRFVQSRKNECMHKIRRAVSEEKKTCQVDEYNKSTRPLNTTFNLSFPSINLGVNSIDGLPASSELNKTDDNTLGNENCTYECNSKLLGSEETSPPVLKDCRNGDKPKADKTKSKSTDTSPLPNNKSRVSDILPSLFNKENKDRSGLRELDKMFDMEAEYEEDFMYSSDLSLKCDYLKSDSNNATTDDSLKTIKSDSAEMPSNDELSNSNIATSLSKMDKDRPNSVKE